MPPAAPVLVVGAGPVGLLTALALHRREVPVRLLEQRLQGPHASRASSFQPPVLDRLAELGLLEALEPLGRRVERIASWDLEQEDWRELSLDRLAERTAHPYRLHLEQQHLVKALEERLETLSPGAILRGMEVIGFDPAGPAGAGGVAGVIARDSSGALHPFRGSWIVAADGAHSSLRQAAGLTFAGEDEAAPVVRLFVPHLPAPLERRLAPLTYVRRGPCSLSFLQMRDGWRVILRPSPADVSAALACDPPQASAWSLDRLRSMFADESAWNTVPISQDHYPVRQRQVERHRLGRLLLIGDAAHVTNTRGGLNMNFGLLEGLALAEALASETAANTEPVKAWADSWQQLTTNVLLPRTASMRGAGTVFDLADAEPNHWPECDALLVRATLLDLP